MHGALHSHVVDRPAENRPALATRLRTPPTSSLWLLATNDSITVSLNGARDQSELLRKPNGTGLDSGLICFLTVALMRAGQPVHATFAPTASSTAPVTWASMRGRRSHRHRRSVARCGQDGPRFQIGNRGSMRGRDGKILYRRRVRLRVPGPEVCVTGGPGVPAPVMRSELCRCCPLLENTSHCSQLALGIFSATQPGCGWQYSAGQ